MAARILSYCCESRPSSHKSRRLVDSVFSFLERISHISGFIKSISFPADSGASQNLRITIFCVVLSMIGLKFYISDFIGNLAFCIPEEAFVDVSECLNLCYFRGLCLKLSKTPMGNVVCHKNMFPVLLNSLANICFFSGPDLR